MKIPGCQEKVIFENHFVKIAYTDCPTNHSSLVTLFHTLWLFVLK